MGLYINKPLGLKKVEKPEWNSPSSRQPVLWIPMHFFEMSLAEGKKKWSFEFVDLISAIGGLKCRYLSLDVSSREDFEKLLIEDGML